MSSAAQLAQGIAELGLQIAADVQARLNDYLALIEKWNGQLPTVESGGQSALMLQLPHQ